MTSQPIANAFLFCPGCAAANPAPGAIPFRCESCGYANFFSPVAAVGAIVVNGAGDMLLLRRARNPGKGQWGLPGGFVDAGESGDEAVCREVWEETNLKVIHTDYMFSAPNMYDYKGVISPVVDFFYLAEVDSLEDLRLDREEIDYHEWTQPTPSKLENMAFQSNRLAIEHWVNQRSS